MNNGLVEHVARGLFDSAFEGYGKFWDESADFHANYIRQAKAALAAIEASGTHVVVPVEPTDDMTTAGAMVPRQPTPMAFSRAWWRAMLAARPEMKETP